MKFRIEKNTFTKLLSSVCNVASKKNPNNPTILQNIKIETKDNFLYLTGTDSDTYIKDMCKVVIEEEGKTTVPALLIYDIVKKMEKDTEIECEYSKEENFLFVKGGKSKFKLMCLDADGYPNFEEQQMQIEFKINPKDLVNLIDKTRFSISDDASRYYLNGLFLQTRDDEDGRKLVGVSTDGHKLSVITLNYFNGKDPVNGIIIPKKTLPEIKKILLSSTKEEVIISLSKTKIKIETEDTIIISKLIDADFPDYKKVIPQENNKILNVEKSVLSSTIDRVATIVNEGNKSIKFLLTKNNLNLESNSAENGTATEDLTVNFDYDDKIEMGFNSKFMLDFFTAVESDRIDIYFKDSSSAIIIKGCEEPNNVYILMPIRI